MILLNLRYPVPISLVIDQLGLWPPPLCWSICFVSSSLACLSPRLYTVHDGVVRCVRMDLRVKKNSRGQRNHVRTEFESRVLARFILNQETNAGKPTRGGRPCQLGCLSRLGGMYVCEKLGACTLQVFGSSRKNKFASPCQLRVSHDLEGRANHLGITVSCRSNDETVLKHQSSVPHVLMSITREVCVWHLSFYCRVSSTPLIFHLRRQGWQKQPR